jgi:hypothetical protein
MNATNFGVGLSDSIYNHIAIYGDLSVQTKPCTDCEPRIESTRRSTPYLASCLWL